MTSNLPNVLLKSPSNADTLSSDMTLSTLKNEAKFQKDLYANSQQAANEMHQNRMKNLCKELDYLKDTEWKYEPIEKYIGQTF